jgi:ribosomal protein S18 acetylase RimI-like enzyme
MTEPTRIKADLIPYNDEYARDVRSWLECEETYRNVCQAKEFPPPDNVVATWQRPNVVSYLLMEQNRPVAYGELWNRPLEMAVEIAHLVVTPYKRSQGYGSKMVELLFNRAATRAGVAKVVLNLRDVDETALGCYLRAGFELYGMSKFGDGLCMVRMIP